MSKPGSTALSGTQIHPSCCSGVFVDQSAESVASLELVWRVGSGETEARPWYRWCQPESAMWPMGVVVVDVDAQDALELPAAGDQEPVEAVAADGADPAFGERVRFRRSKWGADDLDTFAAENLVEVAAELAVTIVDQEAGRCRSPGE